MTIKSCFSLVEEAKQKIKSIDFKNAMKLHNEGWSNKEIVTFLNLNGIKRRNKKDDYKVKDIFMCLKKLKIREKRKSNIKYKLGKWELWREY